ncbi:mitochondrial import inner membrane translocase subunit Tim29 [Culicoides brevitarsis]|uniref:mitochondrial import inner membrane translocase subunit Tim29 n=1 Tax=Culicoides brevitarsis TaxID=469753 RepID=UPI00307BBF81
MSLPNIRNIFSPKIVQGMWSSKYSKKLNFELPERFKGTIVEKWANYWKQLVIDYKEMVIDTCKHMFQHPLKTSIYTGVGATTYFLCKHNPDFADFEKSFQNSKNLLILVAEPCQNPVSADHIRSLERYINQNVVRRLSLGVISFIWIDNYDKDCSLYKATCEYLKPPYKTFKERVIDVGFLDKYWILDEQMKDYDVNF